MHRFAWRAGMALALVGALCAVPSQPANADPVPPTQYAPIPLTDMNSPSYLISQPDGSVTLGCSGGTTGTKRISATGAVVQNLPNTNPYPATCVRTSAVGSDGALFTVVSGPTGWPSLQAIHGDTVRWTYEFTCWALVRGMVVGVNGNVHVLAHCNGQNVVMAFAPGGSVASVVFTTTVVSNVLDGGMAATNSGLALRTETGIQRLSYTGVADSPGTVPNALSNVYQDYQDATLGGRVFVPVRAATHNCGFDTQIAEVCMPTTQAARHGCTTRCPPAPMCTR